MSSSEDQEIREEQGQAARAGGDTQVLPPGGGRACRMPGSRRRLRGLAGAVALGGRGERGSPVLLLDPLCSLPAPGPSWDLILLLPCGTWSGALLVALSFPCQVPPSSAGTKRTKPSSVLG